MVIRAMPSQIPKLWDAIKFAAKAATQMEGKEFEAYLVKLLAALLSWHRPAGLQQVSN